MGFHHKQHSKSSLGSTLEKIPGVGESRRKALMKHFRSIKAIRGAQLAELEQVLPKNVACQVYDYLREETGAAKED